MQRPRRRIRTTLRRSGACCLHWSTAGWCATRIEHFFVDRAGVTIRPNRDATSLCGQLSCAVVVYFDICTRRATTAVPQPRREPRTVRTSPAGILESVLDTVLAPHGTGAQVFDETSKHRSTNCKMLIKITWPLQSTWAPGRCRMAHPAWHIVVNQNVPCTHSLRDLS